MIKNIFNKSNVYNIVNYRLINSHYCHVIGSLLYMSSFLLTDSPVLSSIFPVEICQLIQTKINKIFDPIIFAINL